MSKIPDYFMGL